MVDVGVVRWLEPGLKLLLFAVSMNIDLEMEAVWGNRLLKDGIEV